MSEQAQADYEAPLPNWFFVDAERPENPVRFLIDSAVWANEAWLVRKNLLWCLWQLPLHLWAGPTIWGRQFVAKYRGQKLYLGTVDNRNRRTIALGTTSHSDLSNDHITTSMGLKRMAIPLTNATLTNLPVHVEFTSILGERLAKKDIFSTILNVLLFLASQHKDGNITNFSMTDQFPIWIFVMYNTARIITQHLQIHHIISLLNTIAEFYVSQYIYQELTFRLTVSERVLAVGCITKNVEARRWCAGMGLQDHAGLETNVNNSNNATALVIDA